MKKRIIGITMAIIMGTGLCACGKKEETKDNQKPKATATMTPTEKATFTPKATEEATSEAVSVVTDEAVSATENAVTELPQAQQQSAEPQENSEVSSNITNLNKTMYATQDVNTRSGPSTSHNKVGSLTTNQEVSVTGQDNGSGWYRINVNGTEVFVSGKYLSDFPIDINISASNNNTYSADNNVPAQNQQPQNNQQQQNQQPQQNPVIVEQPSQPQSQPVQEQVILPDIEQTKADIIATLRAKGYVTPEENAIANYGQESWDEYVAWQIENWGQFIPSDGLGWFEGRVSYDDYWQNINGIASNYNGIKGLYWIKYLRTEGKYLIFKCHIGNDYK